MKEIVSLLYLLVDPESFLTLRFGFSFRFIGYYYFITMYEDVIMNFQIIFGYTFNRICLLSWLLKARKKTARYFKSFVYSMYTIRLSNVSTYVTTSKYNIKHPTNNICHNIKCNIQHWQFDFSSTYFLLFWKKSHGLVG